MDRTLSCITVFAMLLVALGICLKQTIEFRELMESSTLAVLFSIEGIAAGLLIASSVSLLRARFARQKKPFIRQQVAAAV